MEVFCIVVISRLLMNRYWCNVASLLAAPVWIWQHRPAMLNRATPIPLPTRTGTRHSTWAGHHPALARSFHQRRRRLFWIQTLHQQLVIPHQRRLSSPNHRRPHSKLPALSPHPVHPRHRCRQLPVALVADLRRHLHRRRNHPTLRAAHTNAQE